MTNTKKLNTPSASSELENINLSRLEKSLKDCLRKMIIKNRGLNLKNLAQEDRDMLQNEVSEKIKDVVNILKGIYEISGHFTRSETMLRKIGERIIMAMMENTAISIFCPTCPDYAHDGTKYTFGKLGSDIPLLAQKHLEYIQKFKGILDNSNLQIDINIIFLVADQERFDVGIRKNVNETEEGFFEKVSGTVKSMKNLFVEKEYFHCCRMTEFFPNLLKLEEIYIEKIKNDKKFMERIYNDVKIRMNMYKQIYLDISESEAIERTIKVAAQYLAISNLVNKSDGILTNHSTTNLSFVAGSETLLLHNNQNIY